MGGWVGGVKVAGDSLLNGTDTWDVRSIMFLTASLGKILAPDHML